METRFGLAKAVGVRALKQRSVRGWRMNLTRMQPCALIREPFRQRWQRNVVMFMRHGKDGQRKRKGHPLHNKPPESLGLGPAAAGWLPAQSYARILF